MWIDDCNYLRLDDGNRCTPAKESPNIGETVQHKYLVMHYTANGSVEGAVRTLTSTERPLRERVSAHLVIGRDGSTTQLVPFDRIAWHAGVSCWEGCTGLNQFSIGIELVNWGYLNRDGNQWLSWRRAEIDETEVIQAVHKNGRKHKNGTELLWWHSYPQKQIEIALEVAKALRCKYHLLDVIGHDDIAPGSKWDPGPAFPMDIFRARLFGWAENTKVQYETTAPAGLSIRTGPGTQHSRLTFLPKGTRLEIVKRETPWALVKVLERKEKIQGWVSMRWIKHIMERSE